MGRKEGQASSCLASFCAFFAVHSLAGLRAKMNEVTAFHEPIPGLPSGEEREAASQAVYITNFGFCHPGRKSEYIILSLPFGVAQTQLKV